jgi:hypothetical protein
MTKLSVLFKPLLSVEKLKNRVPLLLVSILKCMAVSNDGSDNNVRFLSSFVDLLPPEERLPIFSAIANKFTRFSNEGKQKFLAAAAIELEWIWKQDPDLDKALVAKWLHSFDQFARHCGQLPLDFSRTLLTEFQSQVLKMLSTLKRPLPDAVSASTIIDSETLSAVVHSFKVIIDEAAPIYQRELNSAISDGNAERFKDLLSFKFMSILETVDNHPLVVATRANKVTMLNAVLDEDHFHSFSVFQAAIDAAAEGEVLCELLKLHSRREGQIVRTLPFAKLKLLDSRTISDYVVGKTLTIVNDKHEEMLTAPFSASALSDLESKLKEITF